MFQIVAGEISAFKTIFRFAFLKYFAGFNFTSHTGNWLIDVRCSATGTFILFSQINHTNAAVHSAGSYERIFIQGFHIQSLFFICQGRSNSNAHCRDNKIP
jgi:hypothetical protein